MAVRQLVLIRHSKAEVGSGSDAERALAPRGLRDATALGQWLVEHGVTPDYVVVSPALRTRQTWGRIAAELSPTAEPTFDERIYNNSVADLLAVIADAPESAQTVVVIGHNPSMHELAAGVREFPTSAVAVYDVESAWADIAAGVGTLTASGALRGRRVT
jgi:phosphohistidine phosphatase